MEMTSDLSKRLMRLVLIMKLKEMTGINLKSVMKSDQVDTLIRIVFAASSSLALATGEINHVGIEKKFVTRGEKRPILRIRTAPTINRKLREIAPLVRLVPELTQDEIFSRTLKIFAEIY